MTVLARRTRSMSRPISEYQSASLRPSVISSASWPGRGGSNPRARFGGALARARSPQLGGGETRDDLIKTKPSRGISKAVVFSQLRRRGRSVLEQTPPHALDVGQGALFDSRQR